MPYHHITTPEIPVCNTSESFQLICVMFWFKMPDSVIKICQEDMPDTSRIMAESLLKEISNISLNRGACIIHSAHLLKEPAPSLTSNY